ncbi:PAS domain S-box protein [Devosia albogilva]|uniref:PAS domain S-box protein n=1 Tax=Devosia albogilva TaxID=429726 RepID=A0ABW5QLW1_9HYPH
MSAPSNNAPTVVPGPFRLEGHNALLARIVETAAIGTALYDLEGRLVYANRAFADLLGYTAGAPLPALSELIHHDDASAGRLHLERMLRDELRDYRGEHRLRHADGSSLWVSLVASALTAKADGAPEYLVLQASSIERQKKAEEALTYSESRWNFALESARQGVWDHDIRTDTMFYSRMWRIMRGLSPDEPVPEDHQKAWLSRIHPDDLGHVLANIDRQDRGDSDFDALEYRERRPDGSYVWILSRGKPVEWDEHGNPVRTLGTDTDITRIKVIEQELAAEKERLRLTLESIADGMISADSQGRITFMNPAAEQLTGFTSAEAIGRPAHEVFALRDATTGRRCECPVARCLEIEDTVHREDDMVLVSRTGTQRDIRCTAAPVRMADRAVLGAVLVFQDVTQSRAMQRQLAHSASHDPLTSLPNRAAFEEAMSTATASARDSQRRHSLLYIDLDRFKPVNDSAGHAAGDALLQQVAKTIRGCCRNHDMAARIGGDEFAVLLTDCPVGNARAVAEKIVRAVGALEFLWAGRTYRIGASIGIAEISREAASPLGVMGEADAACYAAKARGRATVVAFGDL